MNALPFIAGGFFAVSAIVFIDKNSDKQAKTTQEKVRGEIIEVGQYESKEMKFQRLKSAEYKKFEKYIRILEEGQSMAHFNSAIAKIEDKAYKKELITYLEVNFKVKLREGTKILTQTEMQEWNQKSDEEKFSDAFGKLPLVILGYMIEAAFVISCILLVMQATG